MSNRKEKLKIIDSKGFHYEVVIEHQPHHGFSNALYLDRIIGQVELNKLREPFSDDDAEWEAYEERFGEWKDEILVNMARICKSYFDEHGG